MKIHTNLLYLKNITRNILMDNHGKINHFRDLQILRLLFQVFRYTDGFFDTKFKYQINKNWGKVSIFN